MSRVDRAVALEIHLYTAGVIRSRFAYHAESNGWQWCPVCHSYRMPYTRCVCKETTP